MSAHLQRGTIAFVVVLVAAVFAAKAVAQHRLERCSKHQPARTELACGQRALHWHASAARWIKNHRSRTLAAVSWPASHIWRSRLKFHRWRMRVDRRTIAEARHRLSRLAPVAWTGGIAHEALWFCIHSGYLHGRRVSSGEGSWTDAGDPYWGGLQMHPGWGYGTSYHASDDSPWQQMAAAERGFHANGYSTAWLEGQWPLTSPPCLSLA